MGNRGTSMVGRVLPAGVTQTGPMTQQPGLLERTLAVLHGQHIFDQETVSAHAICEYIPLQDAQA